MHTGEPHPPIPAPGRPATHPQPPPGGAQAESFVDALRRRCVAEGEREAFCFLANGEEVTARLSFAELDRRARGLAVELAAAGARGERVLLLYPAGLEFVVAFCACLYAGAVAVPAYPPKPQRSLARLRAIFASCMPRLVLTTAAVAARRPAVTAALPEAAAIPWLATDAGGGAPAGDWQAPLLGPRSLAFLQYTSGSTAVPRGVMVSHGNLLANERMIAAAFAMTRDSVVVGWLPFYHDMGLIGNVLQPLYSGARAVLMTPLAFLQRPERWLRAISRYGATTSGGPDFAFRLCCDRVRDEDCRDLDLGCWRTAFDGSEPVRADTLERFASRFGRWGFRRASFYPCYGLAEATLFASGGEPGGLPTVTGFDARALEAGKAVAGGEAPRPLVACGRPWLEGRVVIASAHSGELCAAGEVGEIWLAGPHVAHGYWDDPEASAACFAARLAGGGEGPFLRTGDLGTLHDGQLFVTGRLKDLIILRGRNLYPQDLEATAERSAPGLRAHGAVAFTLEAAPGELLVIAQEVERGAACDLAAAGTAIRQALADEHEVAVSEVILLRAGDLPRTSSGKLQRHLCRERYLAGDLPALGRFAEGDSAAQPALGQSLADTLRSCADEDRWLRLRDHLRRRVATLVGAGPALLPADRPLSALGVDSLLAADLQRGLESDLGVELPLAELIDAGLDRLADLALDAWSRREDGDCEPAGEEAGSGTAGPGTWRLSYGQRALWFLQRLAPDSPAYHLAGAARLESGLDTAALAAAVAALVERHAALRTSFPLADGEPVQRVAASLAPDLRLEDAPAADAAAALARLREAAVLPFDIGNGPLLRVVALHAGDGAWYLMIVVHHLVADFWSLGLMVGELAGLYGAASGGPPSALPPVAHSYAAWTGWQERRLAGPAGEALWASWQAGLGGLLPDLELPTDRPRPAVQTFHGAGRTLALGAAPVAALRHLAMRRGTTLFAVLVSAFAALLSRTTHQLELTLGAPSSGRTRRWQEDLVGYFVNPLVLRADLRGNPTGEELLARTQGTLRHAFAHQDLPFALIAERLRPARNASRPPLVQVMLNFLRDPPGRVAGLAALAAGAAGGRMAGGALALELLPFELPAAQMELMLTAAEAGGADGGLALQLQYNSDLFDEVTAAALLARFATLLAGLAADASTPLDALPVLTPAERRELTVERNRTALAFRRDACVHELIREQAEPTPEATALVFRAREVTYGELAGRAAGMAAALLRLGVLPAEPVAVYMERSPEMVAALLAVMTAGACYLPLDPAYPAARLATMLADAGARWLLSETRLAPRLRDFPGRLLCLDAGEPEPGPAPALSSELPAYLLYTSGTTGRPKGVVVSHRSVVNFFAGMDQALGCGPADTLLAATSIGFDISVLELFWTLSRGARVVLLEDEASLEPPAAPRPVHRRHPRAMDLSLFYFSSDGRQSDSDKYRLLLEGARFADRAGLRAVWTPERHFHAFGGLFPNPALTAAALATSTRRIALRAGSVVLPLHHPVRVAEDWSVIDNLSGGRVAIAFASGWHADDFIFFPEKYAERKEILFRDVDTVRRLWRGEAVRLPAAGGGEVEVSILPRPLQPELPVWITSGGSEETFVRAGQIGANVLTHLLGQTIEEVAAKVRRYRAAREAAGHDPAQGTVTLMLHTFLGRDRGAVLDRVRAPFIEYLRSSLGLIHTLVRRLQLPVDLDRLSPRDMEDLLGFAFERYRGSALFGEPAQCHELVEDLLELGVDEVACLLDFGVPTDEVLASLPCLEELAALGHAAEAGRRRDFSLARQAEHSSPTLFQCTPSRLQTLLLDGRALAALRSLRLLLVGGEPLQPALVRQLHAALPARVVNVYGPTETTVWSAAGEVAPEAASVSLGVPLANTEIYLLDPAGELVPDGVIGGIHIGGEGVARGYLNRADQTAGRFVPDPWSGRAGARLYWTGDLARRRADGHLEFLGRADHQVKVRGHRIEPGEVEAALAEHPGVREAAVVMRPGAGGQPALVAYLVAAGPALAVEELRASLRSRLPAAMVPSAFVELPALPRTPGGKLDRHALPELEGVRRALQAGFAAPATQLERAIAAIWRDVLGLERVGADDNFFDLGGHSLLLAQVHHRLHDALGREIPLVKLLEHPTVRALARHLGQQPDGFSLAASQERARLQQEGRRRRQERVAGRVVTPP